MQLLSTLLASCWELDSGSKVLIDQLTLKWSLSDQRSWLDIDVYLFVYSEGFLKCIFRTLRRTSIGVSLVNSWRLSGPAQSEGRGPGAWCGY